MSKNETNTTYPNWLEPQFENIPKELKEQPWAVWKADARLDNEGIPTGKYNKAPLNPLTGYKVGANKPEKFGTFEDARRAFETGKYTGVGVLLTGNGITGIDIDDAANLFNEKQEVKGWVKRAIKEGAYCETSPSQNGVHLFVKGSLSSGGRKSGGLEIYDDQRFMTVTGHVIPKKDRTI